MNGTLELVSDRMKTTSQGAGNTTRGLTQQIDISDWRAVMDSTQDTSSSFRRPERWNTVPVPERVAQRAIANVDKRDDGCWISRYSIGSHGYAQVGWNEPGEKSHMVLAHRAAWVSVHGQVPLATTIDHLCKVRRCVNPAHLRLLPNVENARRNQGDDFPMGGCRHGHPNTALVPMTRRSKSGARRTGITCGACMKASRAKWAAKAEGYRLGYYGTETPTEKGTDHE